MRKSMLFFGVLIFLIFIISFISAAQEDIDKAYACLNDKISEKTCDKLSTGEKIFSILATGKCRSALNAEADTGGCWPAGNCNLKTTAQALLALKTTNAKNWLLAQNGTPSEITWYLQIEPEAASTCTITYDEKDYDIEIGEDKKISSAAGTCLSLTPLKYWLEISSSCYDKEFDISCDNDFLTNLLFRSGTSLTIHVSEKTSSASSEGTTTEKVESFCFIEGGQCDYEGSLWATLALYSVGEDVDPYISYLITMAEENDRFFPEPFLYILTGYDDFRYKIIEKQTSNGYWSGLENRYYDTALALYPFANDNFIQKEEAKEWLFKEQEDGDDGCWNSGNILDTAFILHSIFPKTSSGGGGGTGTNITASCTGKGYCMYENKCTTEGGSVLNYDCSSLFDVCCSVQEIKKTCTEAGGKICTGTKECTGETIEAADTYRCCFEECEEPEEISYSCELVGFCEPGSCGEGYEKDGTYDCEFYGDVCCVEADKPGPSPLIWILIVLIVLVVLGILFRNKLKEFWFRIKFKKAGPPRARPGTGFPHVSSIEPRRRIMSRGVMPAEHRPAPRPVPRSHSRSSSELDDVLKKLKDMGK